MNPTLSKYKHLLTAHCAVDTSRRSASKGPDEELSGVIGVLIKCVRIRKMFTSDRLLSVTTDAALLRRIVCNTAGLSTISM